MKEEEGRDNVNHQPKSQRTFIPKFVMVQLTDVLLIALDPLPLLLLFQRSFLSFPIHRFQHSRG
jgi:hypothetical protein